MERMSEPSQASVPQAVLAAHADLYRRHGFLQRTLPVGALVSVAGSREALESALAQLLDVGAMVPGTAPGSVDLHPSARVALLSRSVLAGWLRRADRETGPGAGLARDRIAEELSVLVGWAAATPDLPDDLAQRTAELAGVLVTHTLDPAAIDVVARHGGTAATRLAGLAATRARSMPVEALRDHLRYSVSTVHPGG